MTNRTRILQAPTVLRGQRIRAEVQNRTAEAINSLLPPQDIDQGQVKDLGGYFVEVTQEDTVPVRVENSEDPTQFVELDRTIQFTVDPGRTLADALALGIPITIGVFKSE